jgi:hypothetical protein
LLVVARDGGVVALPLIAEARPEGLERVRVADETLPIIVPDFVAQVPEHGAITLAQLLPHVLPERSVRLRDVERDCAIAVARHHLQVIGAAQELEGEAASAILLLGVNGQIQRVQCVQKTTFRGLDVRPGTPVLRIG